MKKMRFLSCFIALALPLQLGAAAGDSFGKNEKYLKPIPADAAEKRDTPPPLRKLVQDAVDSMDKKGRWVQDDTIHISDFVSKMRVLCSYLENLR